MPVHEGIVGPIPEGQDAEDYDRLRRRVLWTMPYGLYVLGSRDGERRNGMTINFVTQVSFDPKWLGVGVEKDAFTHELVAAGGVFTLNLIARDDRAIIRKFSKPVEVDVEASTLSGLPYHEATTGAPILDQAVAFVECRVEQTLDCGGHSFFVGEVVDAGFQQDEDTPILRVEDTRLNYGG